MNGLLDEIHDAAPNGGEQPRGLIICATPRSGCHHLGDILNDSGIGVPTEYFHPAAVAALSVLNRSLRECLACHFLGLLIITIFDACA